jgi:hypothetical protein
MFDRKREVCEQILNALSTKMFRDIKHLEKKFRCRAVLS